jgi:hypothetical protein
MLDLVCGPCRQLVTSLQTCSSIAGQSSSRPAYAPVCVCRRCGTVLTAGLVWVSPQPSLHSDLTPLMMRMMRVTPISTHRAAPQPHRQLLAAAAAQHRQRLRHKLPSTLLLQSCQPHHGYVRGCLLLSSCCRFLRQWVLTADTDTHVLSMVLWLVLQKRGRQVGGCT